MADARLLVTGRDENDPETAATVEVIHEALIQNWGRLQAWMEQDREFRMWQERLRDDRKQWQESKDEEKEGYLLCSAQLTLAGDWLNKRRDDLSEGEITYIETSLKLRDEREAAEEARRQREFGASAAASRRTEKSTESTTASDGNIDNWLDMRPFS